MTREKRHFKIVIATDGSPAAKAAVATAVQFPWPSGTHAFGVVGAKGVTGVRHLLLGSVAEGALNRSPVPVLIVR